MDEVFMERPIAREETQAVPSDREIAVSVVVPVYNEEESVEPLYERIRSACDLLQRPYEVLFIDDGSGDRTFDVLGSLHERDPRVRVVRFRKNYGQTAAMAAGFEHARGSVIVSMDGDLQNDPADIPKLLAQIDAGFDVVCGWRKDRKDKFWTRRLPSIVANWIIGHITGVRIHDNGCSLKAYRAETIKSVRLYGEMHRFIPAMSTISGAAISEVIVNHHPRRFGSSKYGLSRIWRVVMDIVVVKMITGFVSRPARWFGILSLPVLLLGAALLAVLGWVALSGGRIESLVLGAVAFLILFLGVYLLSLGIIGELVMRTGDHAPQKIVRPAVNTIELNHVAD